jgi:hypothetical protein
MKYAVEIGSRVMDTKFHKDWFRHSKTDKEDTQAHRHGNLNTLLLFFKIRTGG